MLNALRLKSSETDTFLYKSFRVLKLPIHLSNLNANG